MVIYVSCAMWPVLLELANFNSLYMVGGYLVLCEWSCVETQLIYIYICIHIQYIYVYNDMNTG